MNEFIINILFYENPKNNFMLINISKNKQHLNAKADDFVYVVSLYKFFKNIHYDKTYESAQMTLHMSHQITST